MRARLLRLVLNSAILVSIATLASCRPASAQRPNAGTPVGRWKTVDDATGKINSVVRIWKADGKLYGRIEQLIGGDPNDPDPRCARCSGSFRDQRLVGLRILWSLTPDGNRWTGGEILDPDSGRIYSCSIALADDGKQLRVRGFIGFSLLGRTEYWLRDE
jgi:uncharacterized protein (DUF2147 family)